MSNVKTITWRKIEGAAKLAFNIYAAQSELKWAKQAWELLIEAGLATYSNEIELYQVIIRFLALAGFYYKFYRVGWGGYLEPNYLEWAEELELNAFHVRQLIKSDPYLIFSEYHNFEGYEDEDKPDSREIKYLVNIAHKEVVAGLLEGFGNEGKFWAIPMLFVSLWRSSFSEEEYQDYEYYEDHNDNELAEEIVATDILSIRKRLIFDWLTQECCSVSVQEIKSKEIPTSHQHCEKTNFENMKDGTSYSEYLFSAKTFELLSRWDVEYRSSPMLPFAHTHYEELIEYVEKPFNKLCRLVSARLPAQLAAQPGDAKWEGTDLEKEFSPFKLLYIRINSNYLAFGYVIKTYRSLFLRSWQNNPEALAKVISGDPATFILPNNEVLIPKNELIKIGIGELSDRIAETFKKHLTMVLLATSDDPMPAIHAGLSSGGSNQLPLVVPPYVEPSLEDIIPEVYYESGLCISNSTLRRYYLALKTRKFVILSGISGTGKTFLTKAYAEAVKAEYLLVPVAPNWTTNEDLLGYFNPIDKEYHYTVFSHFLEKAAKEYEQAQTEQRTPWPYHLVLDEMNLARVEYYFAKFLSAMEVRMREGVAQIELASEKQVLLPPNFYFIGTVNVDETTHSFADKVYDRAQLIELEAPRQDLYEHLGEVPYREMLMQIWDELHTVAPFAFRVIDEIKTYVKEAEALEVSWQDALDEQLLQKILPKLKGADDRVGVALKAFVDIVNDKKFPLSHKKATKMLETFNQHGFTSYF